MVVKNEIWWLNKEVRWLNKEKYKDFKINFFLLKSVLASIVTATGQNYDTLTCSAGVTVQYSKWSFLTQGP